MYNRHGILLLNIVGVEIIHTETQNWKRYMPRKKFNYIINMTGIQTKLSQVASVLPPQLRFLAGQLTGEGSF